MPEDFSDEEYAALADQLGGDTEELVIEFAVVHYRHGQICVQGPFDRRLAEIRAHALGGVIAERTKTTHYGLWTPADERIAEFDKATDDRPDSSLPEKG